MKITSLILIIILCLLISCRTYLDVNNNSVKNTDFEFRFSKEKNEFSYFSNVNPSIDNEVLFKSHFYVLLPKKIKRGLIIDNHFYFEYTDNKLLVFDVGYKNDSVSTGKFVEVKLNKALKEYVSNLIAEYKNSQKYQTINFNKIQIYNDNKTKVILYNFDKETLILNTYIKSFRYLN